MIIRNIKPIAAIAVLSFIALMTSVPPVAYAAPALQALSSLTVVDVHGKLVGPIQGGFGVVYRINGVLVNVQASPSGFIHSGRFLFASTDCSGTPLMQPSSNGSFFENVTVGDPGSSVYVADPGAIPLPVFVQSIFDPSSRICSSNAGGMQTGGSQTVDVIPALFEVDLDTQFTPPFSIK